MIALVFDIGNRDSFVSLSKWLRRAQEARAAGNGGGGGGGGGYAGRLHGVVIGAKGDYREAGVDRADVSAAEAKAFAGAWRAGVVLVVGGGRARVMSAGGKGSPSPPFLSPLRVPRRQRGHGVL